MQKQFKREQRYFVVKVKDAKEYLDAHQLEKLAEIADTISEGREKDGIPAVECVVVESDWPEYEPTWKAIEARVTGAQQAPDGSAVQTAARIMNVDLIRQRDALRAEIEELHVLIAAVKKRADAEFCLRVKKEEEYTRLRAKIEAMEQQEPVAWYSKRYGFVYMSRQPSQFERGSILYLRNGAPAWRIEGSSKVALLDMASLPHGTVFYALPGAQGEEK